MKKILHILPDGFNDPEHTVSGGAKGVNIFIDYLIEKNIFNEEITVKNRSDKALLNAPICIL